MGETTAMSSVVTALQSILTTDAMFTNLAALIPVVGGVLIFAFTYRIIRRIVNGSQKEEQRFNLCSFIVYGGFMKNFFIGGLVSFYFCIVLVLVICYIKEVIRYV